MGRRGKREADVILGAFERQDPATEKPDTRWRANAEVIELAPFLAARRGHPSAGETAPSDPA